MQYLEFGSSENEYLKFDYINITSSYNKYETNLYYVINKNCRDKNKIKNIIFNKNKDSFKISNIKRELEKIGYTLVLVKRLIHNINYYYIVKDNKRSKNLYINNNIINDNIINNTANKLDLSDLD